MQIIEVLEQPKKGEVLKSHDPCLYMGEVLTEPEVVGQLAADDILTVETDVLGKILVVVVGK